MNICGFFKGLISFALGCAVAMIYGLTVIPLTFISGVFKYFGHYLQDYVMYTVFFIPAFIVGLAGGFFLTYTKSSKKQSLIYGVGIGTGFLAIELVLFFSFLYLLAFESSNKNFFNLYLYLYPLFMACLSYLGGLITFSIMILLKNIWFSWKDVLKGGLSFGISGFVGGLFVLSIKMLLILYKSAGAIYQLSVFITFGGVLVSVLVCGGLLGSSWKQRQQSINEHLGTE
jgi:hypothetical protein